MDWARSCLVFRAAVLANYFSFWEKHNLPQKYRRAAWWEELCLAFPTLFYDHKFSGNLPLLFLERRLGTSRFGDNHSLYRFSTQVADYSCAILYHVAKSFGRVLHTIYQNERVQFRIYHSRLDRGQAWHAWQGNLGFHGEKPDWEQVFLFQYSEPHGRWIF